MGYNKMGKMINGNGTLYIIEWCNIKTWTYFNDSQLHIYI